MSTSVARLLVAGALAFGACSGGALADDGAATRSPVVVELFTSQGCSACPPADELLRGLAARKDVIALALHVDYWDYLGWKDSFARPENTARQKAYAHAAGDRMIYTPQIVVDGTSRVLGGKAMAVVNAVDEHRDKARSVALALERSGSALLLEARPLTELGGMTVVQLVRYRAEGEVEILRGENAGRTLSYTNIVTAWDVLAEWDGRAPLSLRIELDGTDSAIVLVQEKGHGPILAAARSP